MKYIFAFLVALSYLNGSSQNVPNSNIVESYEKESIRIQRKNGLKYKKGEIYYKLKELKKDSIFLSHTDLQQEWKKYRKKVTVYHITAFSGSIILGIGIALDPLIGLGGLSIVAIGTLQGIQAENHLQNIIWLYNKYLLEDLEKGL